MNGTRPIFKNDQTHPDDVRMTLGEHLDELRTRLIRSIFALVVGATVVWFVIDYVEGFMTAALYAALDSQDLPRELISLGSRKYS